jgi:hypothetical protein
MDPLPFTLQLVARERRLFFYEDGDELDFLAFRKKSAIVASAASLVPQSESLQWLRS